MAGAKPPYEGDEALNAGKAAEYAAEAAAKASDKLRSNALQNLDALRRQAEQRLVDPDAAAAAAAAAASLAADDIEAVIHELQVHQIELETQNENLRRTHIELDAQREKYFERFDMAPVGYLVLDDKGIVRDANLTAAHLLGVERQLLIGQPLSAYVFVADHDAFYLLVHALMKTGEPQSVELRLHRLAGDAPHPTPFWALLEARPKRGDDGTPDGVWMAFTDIDERRRAEAALRASEDKFRHVFEHSPIGKSITLPTGEIRVNQAFCDMLGYSQDELERTRWQDITQPEDVDATQREMDALLAGERKHARFEKRFVHKSGSVVWADVTSSLRCGPDGEPLYFVTALLDVTARRRAEQELQQSRALLQGAMDQSQAGIAIAEAPDGELRYVNQAGLFIRGASAAEVVDQVDAAKYVASWHILHHDGTPYATDEVPLARAVLYGETSEAEFIIRRNDEEDRIVLARAAPIRDDEGTVTAGVVVFHDITERKQSEDEIRRLNEELEERVVSRTTQLEATNKELEAFAYSVSHDLRAPLRAIDGFSQMVMEDAAGKLSEADVAHLDRVRAGAQRMATLIDELLGLSRVSRRDILIEEVDLSALATEVIDELREAQPGRQVVAVVAPGLRARADAALLRVILANLLSNAWKFTSKHETARLEVGFTDAGGERAFYVRDDGAGFDLAKAEHLFGAFQRLHTTEEFEGDGIGLATVQRLVTRHGGRVWAEAEVEKGATFYFTLPGEAPQK